MGVTSVTSGCDLLGPSEVSDLSDSEGLGVQGGIYQQASEIHTGVIGEGKWPKKDWKSTLTLEGNNSPPKWRWSGCRPTFSHSPPIVCKR